MGFDLSNFGLSRNRLPSGWREDRLDSIAKFNPEQIGRDYPHEHIHYLDISNVGQGTVGNPPLLSLKDAPSRAKRIVSAHDSIISTVRPGNKAYAFFREAAPNLIVSTGFAVLRATTSDPRFLYYLATCDPIIDYLTSIAEEKTAYPSVNPEDIAELLVPVPPLPEQRAIAHILGTVDDKIELNRRMNETLEAMARAIFKSWFVDFDPVKAKAARKKPAGMSDEIVALFPDRFQDSELGKIPNGWEVKPIGDLADVVGGSTPSTKEAAYWNAGSNHWATPKDLSLLSVPVLLDTERRITDAGLRQISSGLLSVGTVLLSSRAPIGYLAVAEVPVAINQGFIAMKPRKCVSNLFLLLWASFAHEEILSRANGSTFLEISKSNFRPIPLIAPPTTILEAFDHLIRPLYERIVSNEREIRTHSTIRDSLLPKLISGEIRLKNGGKFLEAAHG